MAADPLAELDDQTYLRQWLDAANHYRMQLLGDAADNPDQRIADDLQMFVDYTLTIGIGLLNVDRELVVRSSSFCGPFPQRPRCICSARPSRSPAIWCGPR